MATTVIIPSAGVGSRMKSGENKIFLKLNGESILHLTLSKFSGIDYIEKVILPCREEDRERIEDIAKEFEDLDIVTVKGGQTRAESVKNALAICGTEYVLVHDCVRPFVTKELIDRVQKATETYGAVIPVIDVVDTIKEVKGDEVVCTRERSKLKIVQTPQGFLSNKLKQAYDECENLEVVTDDAGVYEKIGKVYTVQGEAQNIKITTPDNLPKEKRVGVGFDAHRFEKGREMWLGGVKLDLDYGLLGHSDADVVLHAIMDALLSSVHLRDIGVQFPCTPEFKDISSAVLFERVMEMLSKKGAKVQNISVVIVCEKPKLAHYIDSIAKNIARLARIAEENVSLSATTTEKLGFTGREEGIATEAVCIVEI